jgi:hypothetical protein
MVATYIWILPSIRSYTSITANIRITKADRNNDPVVERVSKYIEHDLVSVIFIKKYQVYIEHLT